MSENSFFHKINPSHSCGSFYKHLRISKLFTSVVLNHPFVQWLFHTIFFIQRACRLTNYTGNLQVRRGLLKGPQDPPNFVTGLIFHQREAASAAAANFVQKNRFWKGSCRTFFLLLLKMNGPEEPSLDSLKLKNKFDFFELKIGKNWREKKICLEHNL